MQVFGIGRGTGLPPKAARVHPGQLRMQTELAELELPDSCKIDFPEKNDLLKFTVAISPDEGYWRGGKFKFAFLIKPLYPHDPPKVKCETQIYHPNIDLDGNVCLNILREDWKPILSISAVIYGLLYLLLEPNPNDPLNKEAAEVLRNNKHEFARLVSRTLHGSNHQGKLFPRFV